MRKYLWGAIIFICLSFSACIDNDATILSVNVNPSEFQAPSFYDYFSKVEITPLEDSIVLSNNQYSEPQYLAVTDDSFFILDERTNSVFRFGKDGKFIEESSRRGRGSGEYTLAYAIRADEISHSLKVLDPRGTIYCYDIIENSQFMSAEKLEDVVSVHNFIQAGESIILFSSSEKNHLRNWDGKEISNIPYTPEIPLKGQYNAADPIISNNNNFFYFEGYSGNIYSLSPDLKKMDLSYTWDFGNHSLNLSKIRDPHYDFLKILKEELYDTVFPFTNMQIIGDEIFANVIFHNQEHSLIYNINTGKYSFFRTFSEGIRFKFHAVYDGNFFLLVEPENINEFVNKEILDEHNNKVLEDIRQGHTTPIIIKYLYLTTNVSLKI